MRENAVREVDIWPWSAAEDVPGDSAKVSRSRRMAEDCLRAALNKEFYRFSQLAFLRNRMSHNTMVSVRIGGMYLKLTCKAMTE